MKRGIDILNQQRSQCCIRSENRFVFANTALGPVDGWQVLQGLAKEAQCEKAELITATRLRKYIATCAQVSFFNIYIYYSGL